VSKPKKFGVTGVGVGVCLALLMVAFAYYPPPFFYNFSTPYLCLAPASIIYELPLERMTLSAHVMIVLIIAISNALIYGVTFFVIGKIWVWFHGRSV
jgi:hypothetical protein